MNSKSKGHIINSVQGNNITVPIYIGKDSYEEIKTIVPLHSYSKIFVILDENVSSSWSEKINKRIGEDACYHIVPSGEKNKTLATIEKIWIALSNKGFDRKSLIINIGGGMVCDVGAFAAGTYMRGIDFVQIPTTLLAQTDAAIGGKTGFNFNGLKNTIGTFSNPLAVISDTSFLTTLPKREYASGFAEIIKHAIIADRAFFNYLLNTDFTSLDNKELDKILFTSCNIKCDIVRRDPLEKNERKKLNFGHTVGHAIEMTYQDTPAPTPLQGAKGLLHGEAVAIGMIAEARMSLLTGHISEKIFSDIENLIKKVKLPVKVSDAHYATISKKMLYDKKSIRQQIQWVFLEDIGKVKIDISLQEAIVTEGLNYILE